MSNKQNDEIMEHLNENFALEMQESKAEQAYADGHADELMETLANIMPLLTEEQLDAIISMCEVETRERDTRTCEYAQDLPF